ncbi:hypothetical protein CDEST_04634 [Colletotrichum destructivum]|uniref:Uncharacterized protein n=1 Tax=Colletotrichum destructivum TaxID=34406 RepID=A0AAX4I9F7_9PEZI|nr:hypothetical protein CDEST_04634 [Colletotrichum destructivum]
MGGKVWSVDEERVFWRVIVPQSQKRIGNGPAHVKNWEQLAPLMQSIMGIKAKRTYTHLGLFEHFFQNIEKSRVSPNAGIFVREYQNAVKRANKAREEEKAQETEFDYDSDDATTFVNESQDADSQVENGLGYHTDETTEVEDHFENDSEEDAVNGDKKPRLFTRFPAKDGHSQDSPFPHQSGRILDAGMGHYNKYVPSSSVQAPLPAERLTFEGHRVPTASMSSYGDFFPHMPIQALLSAERSTLEGTYRTNSRAPSADLEPHSAVPGMPSRPPAEQSPLPKAPLKAPKRRSNHRAHPYEGDRLQRRGRVHSQIPQESTSYYGVPDNHHSVQHYYTPMEFGDQVPSMTHRNHGYHNEHFQPYPENHGHSQFAQSHPMGLYDRSHSHPHVPHPQVDYAPRQLMANQFFDAQDWHLLNRNSPSMAANCESYESRTSSPAGYYGRESGLMAPNHGSSESRSMSNHGYDSSVPEYPQRHSFSASGSWQPVRYGHRQGRHAGSHSNSPQILAEEHDGQLEAALGEEIKPSETPAHHWA